MTVAARVDLREGMFLESAMLLVLDEIEWLEVVGFFG